MKQLKTITGIIFLILSIYSCGKTEVDSPNKYLDQMPEETRIGANTFGYYINGELAAAQGPFQEKGLGSALTSSIVNGFLHRYIDTYIPGMWMSKDTTYFEMELRLVSKFHNMQIKIDDIPALGSNKCTFYIDCDTLNELGKYIKSSVDITRFDKNSQVIAGRFDKLEVHFNDFPVHITKGQFDIKYGKNF